MEKYLILLFLIPFLIFLTKNSDAAYHPDLILINGKIITVDQNFSIVSAVAIKDGKFITVGSNKEIKKLAGKKTIIIDLNGKTVLPGLTDGHLHPETAARSELFDEIPDVHSKEELLNWIKNQATRKAKGEWIIHTKFFPTRLEAMKYPILEELNEAAPQNPVFLNGSYGGMINSYAMQISNITEKTDNPDILRDSETGKLTGLIRSSVFKLLAIKPPPELSYTEELDALEKMISRYNQIGFTSLCSASGGPENFKLYFDLKKQKRLTARIYQNISLPVSIHSSAEEIKEKLINLGYYTGFGDEWIRIGALKTSIDGGILTGTAYLREPWGKNAEEIYGITDMTYRGFLKMNKDTLAKIAGIANEIGWKFTAHCTGGGGVDVMLDAFEQVNKSRPIKDRRFSIIHGNFYTPEAIQRMKNLGVYADMQPAWYYKDADAMNYVLGEKRIKTFHPYKSLFEAGVMINGGSDHMVKFDADTSINPYNPFIAMWSVIARKTERNSNIVPDEAISREQALKMYTINNAYASFEEDIKGSIEPGKLADLIVISEDFLTCPEDKIKEIKVEMTMVGGETVYESE
jgi:predicted amidohydrolase YtcJ